MMPLLIMCTADEFTSTIKARDSTLPPSIYQCIIQIGKAVWSKSNGNNNNNSPIICFNFLRHFEGTQT